MNDSQTGSTSTTAAFSESELLVAGRILSSALAQYRDAVLKIYSQPGPIIDLDETMDGLLGTADALDAELSDLKWAIALIESDAPIAEVSSRGRRWKGALSPKWLLYFARLGQPGDPGYRALLEQIRAKDQTRADDLQTACGRPTVSGNPCRAIPVLWPGGGRDSGCNRHLTPQEKADLDQRWEQVQTQHGCPGCKVAAGAPCEAEPAGGMEIVEGEWPRERRFNKRMLHEPRLMLGV